MDHSFDHPPTYVSFTFTHSHIPSQNRYLVFIPKVQFRYHFARYIKYILLHIDRYTRYRSLAYTSSAQPLYRSLTRSSTLHKVTYHRNTSTPSSYDGFL